MPYSRLEIGVLPQKPEVFDVVIVGKPPAVAHEILNAWARFLEVQAGYGAKVVIDFTDNHLVAGTNSPIVRFYRTAFSLASIVCCPTEGMRDYLVGEGLVTVGTGFVIPDWNEFEGASSRPHHVEGARPLGIWFGHASNLQYLRDALGAGGALSGVRLLLVTAKEELNRLGLIPGKWDPFMDGFVLPVVWNTESLARSLATADYAVLPSDPDDLRKRFASPNRLVSCLTFGLPTLATSSPGNSSLRQFFLDLGDPKAQSLVLEPAKFRHLVNGFSPNIAANYSLAHVRGRWFSVIQGLRNLA